MPDELALYGINAYHLSILRNNRADEKEYLNRRENQSHPDMKVPILTGSNFGEFNLVFDLVHTKKSPLLSFSGM